jgi:hypothetical protein
VAELGLPALGSFLWSPAACPDLDGSKLANQALLAAVRGVGFVEDRTERVLRPTDYRNLGSEELGAIYESLLEQHPVVNADAGTFSLNTAAGNERKTTGSYYTPTSLITELLDSTVDPVVAEAASQADPEAALLALRVIDPACGSGHFLIAAAHRIAKRLAAVRTGDDEPSPDATRSALRDVIVHCVHGIDLNPMAVELCKVSLWMESMEPGRPLGFLDHRIVCGNGLLGATPDLLDAGVPDDAFKALTGDDKAIVTAWKKRNKQARAGRRSLFGGGTLAELAGIGAVVGGIDAESDDDLAAVEAKARRWSDLVDSPAYRAAVHAADTWCAAFVAPRTRHDVAITHDEYRIARDTPDRVEPRVRAQVDTVAGQYAFLHWHLAFPDVYADRERGGFDVVLGNPPWEKVKLSEKEFFAARAPEIANLAGARRKAAIQKLQVDEPYLWDEYLLALRRADGESHFIRSSGRYPLCGRGDVNTYAVFAEAMRNAVSPSGRAGFIVPTGIATDDTTKHFFADLVARRQLASLFDFENAAPIFSGVHRSFKFSLLTIAGVDRPVDEAEFVFFAHQPSDLSDPERRFTLSPDDLALINPNTRTAPVFRTRRDAEITKAIYRRVPVLVRDGDPDGNPWGIEFSTMFHMTNDSHLFRTADELRAERARLTGNTWVLGDRKWLPLYEAKMAHHFTHRFGDYALRADDNDGNALPDPPLASLQDPAYVVQPRYWVAEAEVRSAMRDPKATWLLGFRDICRATDERTMIDFVVPLVACGHNLPLIHLGASGHPALLAALGSFVGDYVARQKVGGTHMTYGYLKQLAVVDPGLNASRASCDPASSGGIEARVLELSYTAWDLAGYAQGLGYSGPPFRWDPARRELLRAELDAAFFHLYGIERDDVDYIMDTFPIVRRKDEAAHGEYRTKRLILERYDALAEAAATGTEYRTMLDPPPADPRCAHPASTRPEWA